MGLTVGGLDSCVCAHHSQQFSRKDAGLTCKNDDGVVRGAIFEVHLDSCERIVVVAGRDEIVIATSTRSTQQCMLGLSSSARRSECGDDEKAPMLIA